MSNLPAGFSITSISGRRCTAIPRTSTTAAALLSAVSRPAIAPLAAVASPIASPATTSTASDPNSGDVAAVVNLAPSPVASTPILSPTITQQIAPISIATLISTQSTQLQSTQLQSTQLQSTQLQSTQLQSTQFQPIDPVQSIDSLQSTSTNPSPIADNSIFSSPTTTTASNSTASSTTSSTQTFIAPSDVVAAPKMTSAVVNNPSIQASAVSLPSITQNPHSPDESSAASGLTLNKNLNIGPIVGGSLGGLSLVLTLSFLCWRYSRKRKSRDSLLTPLHHMPDTSPFEKYGVDDGSVDPTSLSKKWKAQASFIVGNVWTDITKFCSTVKTKLCRKHDTPSIDMNRGNSQFLEPILQHKRSNSAASGRMNTSITARDRFMDWWERVVEDIHFNWRLRNLETKPKEVIDPFAVTRSMKEKEALSNQITPDFTQFLVIKDHELRQSDGQHRGSFGARYLSGDQLGTIEIDLSDPFADPSPTAQPTLPNLSESLVAPSLNPFADPAVAVPTLPKTVYSKPISSNYISEARWSRGQLEFSSTRRASAARYPPTIVTNQAREIQASSSFLSPYESTIRTSRDTYRDTFLSNFTNSGRRTKARSDPFDLENPNLWRPANPTPGQASDPNDRVSRLSWMVEDVNDGSNTMQPRRVSAQASRLRRVSESGTYPSKYSSGASAMSAMSEWGDPGPDLGPAALKRAAEQGGDGMKVYGGQRDSRLSGSSNGVGKAL